MNNFDRIQQELTKEAARLAPRVPMDPDRFLEIVIEIVDAEDQHRMSRTNIRQQIEMIISNAALQNP